MTWWLSFNGLKKKLGRFQFLLVLIVALSAAAYMGFKFAGNMDTWQQNRIAELESRLTTLYQEVDNKIREINYLSVELEVENNASEQVKQENLALREELFELKRELNFYHKVVAPELIAEGISVEQFEVERSNIEGRFKFRFALVQTNAKKRNAKGYIKLKLKVTDKQSKQSLDLAKLAQLQKQDLSFSFSYFQYFEGEFELPAGVIAESVEVQVIRPKTKWQAYKASTHDLPWPQLTP